MNYKYWIQERIDSTKQETINYSAKYENKEVRVYSIDSEICINWYINGKLIEKPKFSKEIITEMELFCQTIICKPIDKHLMYEILNTMKRYLPYLEDEENPIASLKYINIVGDIKLE
jgi:hypothetical protein